MVSASRSSKRELERLRRERAARKLEKRKARLEPASEVIDNDRELVPEDIVLGQLAALHQRFANDQIDSHQFEQERDRLLALLRVV